MAVEKIPSSTTLTIQIANGVSPNGTFLYKNLTLSNVRNSIDPNKAYNVARAIADIQESSIGDIVLKETYQLI